MPDRVAGRDGVPLVDIFVTVADGVDDRDLADGPVGKNREKKQRAELVTSAQSPESMEWCAA